MGYFGAYTTTPSVDRVEVVDMDREEGQRLLWKTKSESARLAAQLTGLVQAKTLCRDRRCAGTEQANEGKSWMVNGCIVWLLVTVVCFASDLKP